MAEIYLNQGGSQAYSSDCTCVASDILANKTAIFKDTNDEPAQGSLPLTAVRSTVGGLLAINSTLNW